MKLKTICFTLGMVVVGCALAYAAEAWESKDPSQWSSEDISKILNDSPWAKHVSASVQQNMGQRGRRMGGMGGGGLGMPGGMGGGYPGGGGGYPGGGGGGYGGRGGSTYPDDQSGSGGGAPRSIDATLRWESALPVQLAEKQRHSSDAPAADAKAEPKGDGKTEAPEEKPYVLMLVGLQLPQARYTDPNANSDDQDSQYGRSRNSSPAAMRQQFMQNTRIVRKNKSALNPSDVKLDADRGEVSFFFRRDEPIDLDDKEVSFETMVGRMKIEKKFKVKDMVYQGKLAL